MISRAGLIRIIHVAKRELGLDDDAYRAALERVSGHSSCADCNEAQLQAIVEHFKSVGWKPQQRGKKFRTPSPNGYVRKVYAVWGQLKRDGIWKSKSRTSLVDFVKKQTGCADPEWLNEEQATSVIYALKAMRKRAQKNAG